MVRTDICPEMVEERVCTSTTIGDLPNEILIMIFSLLDYESIQSVAEVCLRWQLLSLSPPVWENMRLVVSMKNYLQISEDVIPAVNHNLKMLKLQYFKLYSKIRVPLITVCPNIKYLEISISQIDESIFEDLKVWSDLKFLSFRNSLISRIPEKLDSSYTFHIPFAYIPKLETLILSNFALTSQSLDSMLTCQYLNHINIEKMKNIPSQFIESLVSSKLVTLQVFCIYGDTLTDEIMNLISQCTCLSTLHITTCKSLFDSSLLRLSSLKNLKSLKLRHGYFSTNALIKYFSNNIFQKLTFLSLSRCLHVTLQVVLAIKANVPKLLELSFYQCPFIMGKSSDRSEILNIFSIPILLD